MLGRTLCGGKYRCHTQIGTFIATAQAITLSLTLSLTQIQPVIATAQAIGAKLHAAGKAFFWNPSQPRADMLGPFDGVFSELGYAMPSIAAQALLTVHKPNVMWNAGCYLNSTFNSPPISYYDAAGRDTSHGKPWQCGKQEWKQPLDLAALTLSLHGSLHMGIQYSPPYPGADHSAYPFPGDHHELYRRYKPLFMLLKGKRWLLRPHALTGVSPGVLSNLFRTHLGVIVALGMGLPNATVTFTLSFEVLHLAGPCPALVHHALATGEASPVGPPPPEAQPDGSATFTVGLGADGEAVVQIPPRC
jgi:hypothetical protein